MGSFVKAVESKIKFGGVRRKSRRVVESTIKFGEVRRKSRRIDNQVWDAGLQNNRCCSRQSGNGGAWGSGLFSAVDRAGLVQPLRMPCHTDTWSCCGTVAAKK